MASEEVAKKLMEQMAKMQEEAKAERAESMAERAAERAEFLAIIGRLQQQGPQQIVVGNEAGAAIALNSSSDYQDISSQIEKFQYAPEDSLTVEPWLERADGVFASDKGKKLSEPDQTAIVRSKLTSSDYQRLASSILPTKPEELSMDDTKKHLKRLFGRKETLFARRFKAWRVEMRDEEDFATYGARVNKAGEDSEFASFQVDDFKAQLFVQGLKSSKHAPVLKKLLEKVDEQQAKRESAVDAAAAAAAPTMTLHDLVTIAERMIQLDSDRKGVNLQPSAPETQDVLSVSRPQRPQRPPGPCPFCGVMHWAKDCPCKDKECTDCKQKGHNKGFCDAAKRFLERRTKRTARTHAVNNKKSARKYVKLLINGVLVSLKHDSGSDRTFIDVKNWTKIGKPRLEPLESDAVSATEHIVKCRGKFSAVVEVKDQPIVVHDVYVSE